MTDSTQHPTLYHSQGLILLRVRVRGRNQVGPGNYSTEKRYTFAERPGVPRLREGSTTEGSNSRTSTKRFIQTKKVITRER